MASPAAAAAVASAVALRTALVALRGLTLADVASAWRLVEVERLAETCALFGAVAAAVLLRGQRSAVRLADVWAARLFGRPTTGLDPAPFTGLRGTDAPPGAVLASSGAYVAYGLALGHEPDLALVSGLYRAQRLTSTEVTRAGTEAAAELAAAEGSPGWRRHVGPGACPVCVGLADGSIRPCDERVAGHPHCSCVGVPVLR